MPDKEKIEKEDKAKKDEINPGKSEAKPEKPKEKPVSKVANTARPPRKGLLGRRGKKDKASPVSMLASATGTDSLTFAALKVACGWTDRTKLTREEFIRLRDAWLNSSADCGMRIAECEDKKIRIPKSSFRIRKEG